MSTNATSHRIRSITVIGGFLDGAQFDLSDGLNCFIGARGTGKTTALELVRFALDALPVRDAEVTERRRIESLVGRNLDGGQVHVGIETKEGLGFVVSRAWGEEPLVLTRDGNATDMTLKAGSIFRADIFSQNEVERIANETASQLELLDSFEAETIAEMNGQLKQVRASLETNAAQIIPLEHQIAAMTEQLRSLPAVEAKLQAYAASDGENADEINRAHGHKAVRDREQRIASGVAESLGEMRQKLSLFHGRLQERIEGTVDQEMTEGPNGKTVQAICREIDSCGNDLDDLLQRAEARIATAEQSIGGLAHELNLAHKGQELAFRKLMARHQEAQGQAAERTRLEKARNDLLARRRKRDELQHRLVSLKKERQCQLQQLSELQDRRFAVRKSVAERINNALSPAIRVHMIQFGNPELYQRLLETALRGARIKHGIVAGKLVTAFWPSELSKLVAQRDVEALVDRAELNSEQAEKVITALGTSEVLFGLETVELLDQPKIELRDGNAYKDCATLSTGQKCTAILPILLMDSDRPLLIDQPEDNLDNRFIFEAVVDSIRKIKPRRQLIFVTHNPNIPVLGDAEKVFVLDSNGSAARKANEGSVDRCKADIVTLLEGGEEAFKRRKARYAY
ncbi:MAG: hypothetical protein GXY58_18625 [Planctomycetaceae bacterium]|nr:hypothetical protein [Planctomycetaceae bacterium]